MTYTLTFAGVDHCFSELNDTCVTCNEHRTYFEPAVTPYLSTVADGWGVWRTQEAATITLWTPTGVEIPSVKLNLSEGEISHMVARLEEVRKELAERRIEEELLEARKQVALWSETAKEAAREARESLAVVMNLEFELREVKGIPEEQPWY